MIIVRWLGYGIRWIGVLLIALGFMVAACATELLEISCDRSTDQSKNGF